MMEIKNCRGMKKNFVSMVGVMLLFITSCVFGQVDDLYKNLEFPMAKVIEPTFANNFVSIKDFGAVADGVTLNTKAFAYAIDAVSKKGGGKVVVPRGIWLTGPIILKSNINIHT